MPIIHVHDLTKDFRRTKRQTGRFGGCAPSLRASIGDPRPGRRLASPSTRASCSATSALTAPGKSTTIKILTGILVPRPARSGGRARALAGSRAARAHIGVVFGQRSQLWWDLPLIESFKLIGRMYEVPPEMYRRNLDHFVELLDMQSFLDTPVRQLSLGQRMRGDLVAAMLYEPPILYLDEPTVGLDVLAKERIRRFIQDINRERQATVLLTTHDLSDVELLCKRILLVTRDGFSTTDRSSNSRPSTRRTARWSCTTRVGDAPIAVRGAEIVRQDELRVWLRFDPIRCPWPR